MGPGSCLSPAEAYPNSKTPPPLKNWLQAFIREEVVGFLPKLRPNP